jgi:hypothetical protein
MKLWRLLKLEGSVLMYLVPPLRPITYCKGRVVPTNGTDNEAAPEAGRPIGTIDGQSTVVFVCVSVCPFLPFRSYLPLPNLPKLLFTERQGGPAAWGTEAGGTSEEVPGGGGRTRKDRAIGNYLGT